MMQAASALSLPQLGELLHGWCCSTISIFINLTKIPANNDDGTENEKLCSINGANVSFYGLHIKCKLLKRQQPETPDSQKEREEGGSENVERLQHVERQQSSSYYNIWSLSAPVCFSPLFSQPSHFLFPAELPSGLNCVLLAACSAPLPHYVACDTVNDYMYMLHATPSAQMGTGARSRVAKSAPPLSRSAC